MPDEPRSPSRIGGAVAVGAGIFLSRIAGLIRERVFAHYLGLSKPYGAMRAALRIPNFLQNMLGEGVLSSSLIPVYARLRKEGRDEEASQVARAVGTLLALLAMTYLAGHRCGKDLESQVIWIAWGFVIGSAALFLIQLPATIALLRHIRPSLAVSNPNVKQVLHAFVPIVLSRSSVQISSLIDQMLSSSFGERIVGGMANAQVLYLLPVSLFGMSLAARELPEMSESTNDEIRSRLRIALRRVVFLVVPSAVAFVTIGGSLVALLFQ